MYLHISLELVYQLNYFVMDIQTVLMIQMKDGVIRNMILMLLLHVIIATALYQTVFVPQMELWSLMVCFQPMFHR